MFAFVRPDYNGGSYPELWSHETITQAFRKAIQLAQNGPFRNHPEEMWKKAEEIGQIRLNKMKVVCPPNHSLIAHGAITLAQVKANLNKVSEANELVKYAQAIWRVCEDPDHPRNRQIQDFQRSLDAWIFANHW